MALANILRRAASTASRISGRSLHTTTAFSAANLLCPSALRFSTQVARESKTRAVSEVKNKALVQILDQEIKCAAAEQEPGADVPTNFPFKIEDKLGEQVVKLSREYDGENIEVEVYMPDLVTGDDDGADDDSGSSPQSSLPLLVKISKGNGPSLEFSCSAYADEICVDSLSVKDPETSDDMAYSGPDFGDLDENLQKAFHKYLSIRGITPAATNFLHEYMINKDSKEYKKWLKNLKKFVEL